MRLIQVPSPTRFFLLAACLFAFVPSIGCLRSDDSASKEAESDGPNTFTPTCTGPNAIGGMGNKVLDVRDGATVQLYARNGGEDQQLTIGSDRTIRTADGKCLDVASSDRQTPVEIHDCTGDSNQQWDIKPSGEIVSVSSGKCLDAAGASTADGTPIRIYDCWGDGEHPNQKWTTCAATDPEPSNPPPSGTACPAGKPLCVSANRRYLQSADGTPFVYTADLAWLMFLNNLSEATIDGFLKTRAQQGFNVIEAVLVAQWNCAPNVEPCKGLGRNGVTPIDNWSSTSSTKPLNETFFRWVDTVVDRAAAHGLYVGIIPTDAIHSNGTVFNSASAYDYGRRLALRYRDRRNIIWISGGDSSSGFDLHAALVRGIRSADTNHLITYHPGGSGIGRVPAVGTSYGFPNSELLDFHQFQTVCIGGCSNRRNQSGTVAAIQQSLQGGKPIINGEALVEGVSPSQTEYEVRNTTYWTLFAGGAGYAYLGSPVMFFGYRGRPFEGLDLPGASQLQYAKRLMVSRPGYFDRVNDQALVDGADPFTAIALRSADRDHAFVYLARGGSVPIDLAKMRTRTVAATWFNPRTGATTDGGTRTSSGSVTLTAPSNSDWVLVLDAR